jgi:hypothetical protein
VGCYEYGDKRRDAASGGELLITVQPSLLTKGLYCMKLGVSLPVVF